MGVEEVEEKDNQISVQSSRDYRRHFGMFRDEKNKKYEEETQKRDKFRRRRDDDEDEDHDESALSKTSFNQSSMFSKYKSRFLWGGSIGLVLLILMGLMVRGNLTNQTNENTTTSLSSEKQSGSWFFSKKSKTRPQHELEPKTITDQEAELNAYNAFRNEIAKMYLVTKKYEQESRQHHADAAQMLQSYKQTFSLKNAVNDDESDPDNALETSFLLKEDQDERRRLAYEQVQQYQARAVKSRQLLQSSIQNFNTKVAQFGITYGQPAAQDLLHEIKNKFGDHDGL